MSDPHAQFKLSIEHRLGYDLSMVRLTRLWPMIALFASLWTPVLGPVAHAAEDPIYISIDISTVFDTIHDMRQVETTHDLVHASDGIYKPVHGAAAFVQSLLEIPNARIVFSSGGDAERNRTLLSQLIMKDGKSALDHAYKVLSKEDLKDLRKIDPKVNLERVVHVDVADHALKGQERNVLRIDPAYSYVENYSRWLENERQGLKLKNPPPSRAHWALATQRLIWARGILEESFDLMRRRQDISFRDAVQRLQESPDQKRFFEAGQKVLNRYDLEHTLTARESACPNIVIRMLRKLSLKPAPAVAN